jgi:RNA recognition motif-containing protein
MTDKKTGKFRGFAFVDFNSIDRMQTCLKKYHHSLFPDGKEGRKINIEWTYVNYKTSFTKEYANLSAALAAAATMKPESRRFKIGIQSLTTDGHMNMKSATR